MTDDYLEFHCFLINLIFVLKYNIVEYYLT